MAHGSGELAGVVLSAGAGTRLWPLTQARPKALCPVGGTPLVDLALARLRPHVTGDEALAVNLHHGGEQIDRHVAPGVHRSWERAEALGTAGAIGALAPWISGRDVLVTNADAWLDGGAAEHLDLGAFVEGWDRQRTRLLCVDHRARGDFGTLRYCGVALIPAPTAAAMAPVPSGLYEVSWREAQESGQLDLVTTSAAFIDCGTPADYLVANLAASGGRSVVASDAAVGTGARVVRSVVWSDAVVAAGEVLVDAIRTPSATVLVRALPR